MATAMVLTQPGEMGTSSFPERPLNQGEVLLRVRMSGVCGTDRHLFLGHGSAAFPLIAGHEIVGEVVEIADGAMEGITVVGGELQVGRRAVLVPSGAPCGRCFYCLNYPHRTTLCRNRFVYGFRRCDQAPHLFGGFAEYVRVQPRSFLFLIPDSLNDERAVLAEPAAVALRAAERALTPGLPAIGEGLGMGRTALVLGAGPIGLLVVAALRTMGIHRIIAADLMPGRLEKAYALGAHHTVKLVPGEEEAATRSIGVLTDGEGADVVFECAGVPAAFAQALQWACRGGTVVEVGHFTDSGTTALAPHVICHRDLDVRGVWAYPWWQFRDALRFLQSCPLPLEALLTHSLTLDQVKEELAGGRGPEALKPVVRL